MPQAHMIPTHSATEAGCQTPAAQLHAGGAVLVGVENYKQHAHQRDKQMSRSQWRTVSDREKCKGRQYESGYIERETRATLEEYELVCNPGSLSLELSWVIPAFNTCSKNLFCRTSRSPLFREFSSLNYFWIFLEIFPQESVMTVTCHLYPLSCSQKLVLSVDHYLLAHS